MYQANSGPIFSISLEHQSTIIPTLNLIKAGFPLCSNNQQFYPVKCFFFSI